MEPIYRYRAVKPFEEEQSLLFFGREAETQQLAELIFSEKLTVLYGKSGYGKSSLLNAGILPRLKQENANGQRKYLPIKVRFGAAEQKSVTLYDRFWFQFKLAVRKATQPALAVQGLDLPQTLWGLFKSIDAGEQTSFVLLFDQFEEFFSYPQEQQEAFKLQLSELLYTAYPAWVRANKHNLNDAAYDFLSRDLNVRAVFAIRSDRMSDLDSMSKQLDAILKNRMELGPLNPAQARDAIVKPAALPRGAQFKTEPFSYAPDALTKIIDKLSDAGAGHQRIESFVLQIICFSIEKTVERQGLREVGMTNLPDFQVVFDTYYQEQLAEMPEAQRAQAARILQNDLLFVADAEGSTAHRRSVDSQEIKADTELLDALEKTYLIRREINSFGRYSYEISHDTLIEPMLKARKAADAAEAIQRKEQERMEAETRLREAEERAVKEQKLREDAVRAKQRAQWMTGGAVISLLFAGWQWQIAKSNEEVAELEKQNAISLRDEARVARDTADAARSRAELARIDSDSAKAQAVRKEIDAKTASARAEKSLADLRASERARLQQEIAKHLGSAQRMIDLRDYAMARAILTEALRLDSTHVETRKLLNEIRDK